MWNYSFKFVSGATSSSFFLKSICRWLSEGCISGQGDHIAKKIYLMHPAAFLLSIYGRASLVLDSVCFNFTVQLLKKSLLALYCESWKAWLWWIRPYVRSLLQASPGSKPHLFDLFLSVYFFFFPSRLTQLYLSYFSSQTCWDALIPIARATFDIVDTSPAHRSTDKIVPRTHTRQIISPRGVKAGMRY